MAVNKSEEITLEFSIGKPSQEVHLEIPLTIPTSCCSRELSHRLIKIHNIPIFYFEELEQNLRDLIRKKNIEFHKKQGKRYLEMLKNGTVKKEDVVSYWKRKSTQENAKEVSLSEAEAQAGMYHAMVHSPSANSLISLEHSYADAVSSLVSQKETATEELREKQTCEMQQAVQAVGVHLTDDDVNNLAARHLEDLQMLEVKWDSTILALKEEQKREFRKFLQNYFEGKEITTPMTPKEFISGTGGQNALIVDAPEPSHEESFTIHLGTQMKQMHNLRLLAADVLQLFKYQPVEEGTIPPQRIQTSMSLYSSNLNGVVLLVDDRVNTYSGIKKEFGRVSGRTTEFHFPELEDQLETIRNHVPNIVQWRRDHPPPQYECDDDNQGSPQVAQHLKSGDFYITRHSNLADVHVVFHVVTDDSLRSSDINSRHSVILGLRNVLKVACLGDITTLTVPLLLTHTLREEMTISWCQKRAELVFKCIKGFMIEMASWGGTEMKNLQFLVPKGISDDLFNTLASMLQSIFRVSNPLVVKTSK